ncbi:MAG: MBL fold metallo-hydrolase [Candidatus Latescibacterota bacterium]|nr:MAG: MBL fold metallo-hydrolase [Candidatus Latescibacterota bacterium]
MLLSAGVAAYADEEWREVVGEEFTFTEVRSGVWHVRGSGTIAVGSNGALVVNDRDALLVDSHMTPAAARALLADLPLVTDKPIRDLVNTHFHFDHVHGNQVFGSEVEILAHEYTHAKIASGGTQRGRGYEAFIAAIPQRMQQVQEQIEQASAEEKQQLTQRLERMRRIWEQEQETRPTAPTLTLQEAVTLYRGGREIRILHFGRGHTGGDVVVYLPEERVLVAGDLITGGLPYMGDGFLLEWADTLEPLTQLEIDVILPGHGAAFTQVERLGFLQMYLRDLWRKLVELHAQGVSAQEAAASVDMSAHRERIPDVEQAGVSRHTVDRVYELLDANGSQGP